MSDANWKEVRPKAGGAFVKWTEHGMTVEGILRDVIETTGKYGPKNDYSFDGIGGAPGFTVSDTPAMLRELLPTARRGDRVRIIYEADKQVKNGSMMKVFRVLIAQPLPSAWGDEPEPTAPEDLEERDAEFDPAIDRPI